MTFPKRWLDDDGTNDAVRDVLRSGRGMDPPDGAEDAVWSALAAKIAVGVAVTAATTATAKTAAAATTTTATTTTAAVAGGGLLKSILIGAISGVIAVTGYSALEPQSAPPKPPEAAIVAPVPTKDRPESAPPKGPSTTPPAGAEAPPANDRPSSPSSAQPSPAVSSSATADAPPATPPASTGASAAPAPGSPEERASRLREESELLNQARAALRGGDTAGTMRLLEDARRKFPGGALGQEREALAIEALAKSGARAEASARAAAFIEAHPNSPHAARLQVFVTK